MRIIKLIIGVFALTGCNKFIAPLTYGGINHATIQRTGVVLAMGQSNMAGRTPGQNPAVGFKRVHPSITVINCAVGGTSISQWGIGGVLDSTCYSAVVAAKLPVIGILWYQGESDALLQTSNWDQQFMVLVRAWRARYGNVPIVYAQLATADLSIWTNNFNVIKAQQAALSFSKSEMIVTDDLPRQDDVHLTGTADEEVGRRMAVAFNAL